MNHSMNDVKATVQLRPEAKRAFILRIILSVLVFPTVVQYIYMFLSKALKAAGLTGVESVVSLLWKTVGSFIILLVIVLYLYRASIRKWTYSYMLNYQSQAIANGFTVCPRCSSPLNEHTGTGSYSVHVGDEVTTTYYSDGTSTSSRKPIYENRSHRYKYYICSNRSCRLESSYDKIKFGRMPATKKDAIWLVFGQ